ncbi:MAG: DUF3006 domain-containing protein [Clostridiales bacterium]
MQLIIDRFEGDLAICQTPEGESLTLAKALFPPAAQEGDLFLWQEDTITLLPEETARRRKALEERFFRLFKEPEA